MSLEPAAAASGSGSGSTWAVSCGVCAAGSARKNSLSRPVSQTSTNSRMPTPKAMPAIFRALRGICTVNDLAGDGRGADMDQTSTECLDSATAGMNRAAEFRITGDNPVPVTHHDARHA
ncbi:hypothetical protein D3C73_1191450 [compost metagenome]